MHTKLIVLLLFSLITLSSAADRLTPRPTLTGDEVLYPKFEDYPALLHKGETSQKGDDRDHINFAGKYSITVTSLGSSAAFYNVYDMSSRHANKSLFTTEFNYGDPFRYDGDDAIGTLLSFRADSKMLIAIDWLPYRSQTKPENWCRKQVFVEDNNELLAITDMHEGRTELWDCIVTTDE